MTPSSAKSPLDEALGFEVAAKIAFEKGDEVFAAKLTQFAFNLRMQHRKDTDDSLRKTAAVCETPAKAD